MTKKNQLSGRTDQGAPVTAYFNVGLRVGKTRGIKSLPPLGKLIPEAQAAQAIMALRIAQVGRDAAAATITRCEGRWQGTKESSMVCEMKFFPSKKERTPKAFIENMQSLAEHAAKRLGQEEVIVEVGNRVIRANAPEERGPKPYGKGRILK